MGQRTLPRRRQRPPLPATDRVRKPTMTETGRGAISAQPWAKIDLRLAEIVAAFGRKRSSRASQQSVVRFRNVAPAATRSALLLPLAAGPLQKLERRPRRSLTWPVVCVVEVDRVGRRFHALATGSAAGGLGIQPLDRRVGYWRCRADEMVGRWAKRGRPRSTAEPLEVGSRAAARRDGQRSGVRWTWQAGGCTVPMLARRASSVSAS